MKRNVAEIVDAVKLWEELGFDHLGFIMMVARNQSREVQDELLKDNLVDFYREMENACRLVIENKLKITLSSAAIGQLIKLHEEFPNNFLPNTVRSDNSNARLVHQPRTVQQGRREGMPVACVSPFTCLRILFDGTAQLCCKFNIGNVYERDLREIWFGDEANAVRSKLMENAEVCYRCDYYRFCINAGGVDYKKDENFYDRKTLDKVEKMSR
jgi:radical SAM protein with 4Fe4S-binding SPASM domain